MTRRCLKNDLGADPSRPAFDGPHLFETLKNVPIIKAFIRERSEKAVGTRTLNLPDRKDVWVVAHEHHHRGATIHDPKHRVVWLLAYGRHRSGQPDDFFQVAPALHSEGALFPSVEDYRDLAEDRDLRLAFTMRIEAPALLKAARTSGGEHRASLGGRYGVTVSVTPGRVSENYVAIDLRTVRGQNHVQAILAAFHPVLEDWDLAVDSLPHRAREDHEMVAMFVDE